MCFVFVKVNWLNFFIGLIHLRKEKILSSKFYPIVFFVVLFNFVNIYINFMFKFVLIHFMFIKINI